MHPSYIVYLRVALPAGLYWVIQEVATQKYL